MTPPSERLARIAADAARALAGLVFGSVARVRGDRALHPDGRVFAGTFVSADASVTAASPFFADRRERAVLVRLSRGGGLPERLPDVRGCALRVVDAHGPGRHQDVLLASSLRQALGRHLLLPGHDFGGAFYSSLLPYRIGGRRLLFGAVFAGPAGRSLDEVEGSVAGGGLHIRMLAAAPLGTWMEVARTTLDRRAPEADDLRFNPWMTGGAIEPIGALMSLRDPAYRASQAAADGSRCRQARSPKLDPFPALALGHQLKSRFTARRRSDVSTKASVTVGRTREEVERLWRSSEYRPQYIAGSGAEVRFADAPGDRGTEVHVDLAGAESGKLAALAKKVGRGYSRAKVKDDLRRFKQHVETGVIARSEGSPEGERAERKLRQRPAQPLSDSELEKAGI